MVSGFVKLPSEPIERATSENGDRLGKQTCATGGGRTWDTSTARLAPVPSVASANSACFGVAIGPGPSLEVTATSTGSWSSSHSYARRNTFEEFGVEVTDMNPSKSG